MGREIVYCWKCATRLDRTMFEQRKAFRIEDKHSCEECVLELVADLPAEEQERILQGDPEPEPVAEERPTRKSGTQRVRSGQTGRVPTASVPKATGQTKRVTRSIPKVAEPPPEEEGAEEADPAAKKKKVLLLAGGGGGLAVILIVALLFMGGKKKPVAVEEAPATSAAPKPPPGPTQPDTAAMNAFVDATGYQKSNPDQWGEIIKRFREAGKLGAGTDVGRDSAHIVETLLARLEKAVGALDEQFKPQFTGEEFKALLDGLAAEGEKHDVPEWKDAVARKIEQYTGIAADKWRNLKAKVEEARNDNNAAVIEEAKARVAKWGLPKVSEELAQLLAAPAEAAAKPPVPATPAPKAPAGKATGKNLPKPAYSKPLSAEMQAFLPGWQRAMGLAFNRDYEGALSELVKAARASDADEVRKEANADGETISAAAKLLNEELVKLPAATKKLSTVTVEYLHAPGVWKEVTGRAVRVEPTRMELKVQTPVEGGEKGKVKEEIRFVEFADLSASTLGAMLRAKKKTLDKKEALAIATLCFLEGDLEEGRAFAGGQTVADRFQVWAFEARESAPKAGGRELEARDLFHQSEIEWRNLDTRGAAIEKSRTLVNDFAASRISRTHQALLTQRMGSGKDYVFLPTDLKATGDSNVFRFKKDELVWVADKDIDFNDSLYNYVEAEWYALPNTQYRAWVYAGGCCQQVFGALYQTSEGTVSVKGKDQTISPGDKFAPPIPMISNLKKAHDDHKPKGAKDHPKAPSRWGWVSIPLPRQYQTPGGKALRLLTDQAGFAVKYVLVSSTRTGIPNEAQTKEFEKEAQTALASGGATGPKGAAEPKEWMVIGPFEPKLADVFEPEKDIDLRKELKGKGANVKWKAFTAAVAGQKATLDWAKNKIYGSQDNTSAYALIHAKAPGAMDAQLILTHDDGGRAWINGTQVHSNDRGGGFKTDEFKVRVKLEEGWNRLLFKIRNGASGFGLQMRLVDGTGNPIAGLEWHPHGDALEP
jgi:hypothetical protein